MNLEHVLVVIAAGGVLAAGQAVWAADSSEDLQELNRKALILERQRELDAEAAAVMRLAEQVLFTRMQMSF